MGDIGPCGPSSELFFDRGPVYGEDGGPAHGGAERFVEIYNLVFMQYNQLPDGAWRTCPARASTPALGLERNLPMLQGVESLFETDVFRPVLAVAEDITGVRYGAEPHSDVTLRILADHARAMAMVVADGVLPSNEGRGYVLRRVIRRAVRRAFQLGVVEHLTPRLVAAGGRRAGPHLPRPRHRPRPHLRDGGARGGRLPPHARRRFGDPRGGAARRHGRGVGRSRPSGCTTPTGSPSSSPWRWPPRPGWPSTPRASSGRWRPSASWPRPTPGAGARPWATRPCTGTCSTQSGPTRFTGYEHYEEPASVVAVLAGAEPDTIEVVLDRTPFYAESGGQVGDTGVITTETGRARVTDTQTVVPGLIVHRATVEGELFPGQDALAVIDAARRDATRRHHTGTHLLHSALRQVLGDHVRQQGSLVAPDRLRFDFSHPKGLRPRGAGGRGRARQRRRAHRRRRRGHRDVQGRGRGAGRAGLLRRQVRRAGAGGAGRDALARAVRRHPRRRARDDRPHHGGRRRARSAPTCAASRP